ncbi:MAG: UDP-2,3-diacylglucosamine diphosphatase LpxI [Alphaproteobacteria bacterium]
MPPDPKPRLGVVAGSGELPARIVAACHAEGRPVFVLALEGHADPALTADGTPHAWIRLGAAGTGLEHLRRNGVADLVMAGAVRRPSLVELRPDLRTVRFFAKIGLKAFGDDGLLSAVARELELEGFRVVGVDQILSNVAARAGAYGRLGPDADALADIRRGVVVARGLGALDVGQGAVVQQGVVLAVEAVEGTDAMLSRCRALAREGLGGVLVKVAKPGQERRADLPTIGVATVEAAAAAGLRGIAVEAGAALVIDGDAVAARADALGLFVVGLDADGLP